MLVVEEWANQVRGLLKTLWIKVGYSEPNRAEKGLEI